MQILEKKIGETPLEALNRFRREHPTYRDTRLSYAGRLDPLASGKLLLLEGDENNRREEFLALDKTYQFQLLLGVATDTFDLLGLIEDSVNPVPEITREEIQSVCNQFLGCWEMTYPPYSARTVQPSDKKVPLWQLARSGKLPAELPTKKVEVSVLSIGDIQTVSGSYVLDYVKKQVRKVNGDFRQDEILACWQDLVTDQDTYQLVGAEVSAGSGLYVRRLVQEIGKRLGVPAVAFSIHRTEIKLQ